MIGTVSEEALMFIYLADPTKKINDAEYVGALAYLFTSDAAKVLLEYPPKPVVGDKRPALGVLGTDYIFTCPTRYVIIDTQCGLCYYKPNFVFIQLHDWFDRGQ